MSGFAFVVHDDIATRAAVDAALNAAFTGQGDLVWVHLSTTDEVARAWLAEQARLPDYLVDALTAAETRPRCEQIEDGAYLNLRGRAVDKLPSSDTLASVRLWAVKGRVFSVTRRDLTAVSTVERIVATGAVKDPGDLIAAFATAITEDLDPQVADLGDKLDDCEAALSTERIFELRRAVTAVRTAAIGYRRYMGPQRTALERLAGLSVSWLYTDDRQHLASAADRAARMAEELESIRERSAVTHEALTDLRAEQIDQRSLVIAVVAMVFLPLTFINGLLGMNVKGIWFADRAWAFNGVLLLCLVLGIGITGYFVRRRWFG